MEENAGKSNDITIRKPPKGLAVFALVGPSMVWCAEYIGSGVALDAATGYMGCDWVVCSDAEDAVERGVSGTKTELDFCYWITCCVFGVWLFLCGSDTGYFLSL